MDFNAARSDLNFTARYFSNGDGTVTDNTTQLMWQKGDDGTERNWADAGQYCANLILAGHDDWRLPLVGELGGLLPVGPFFGCRPAPYWTSSTYDLDPGAAWYVDFINEDWQGPGWATKTHKYYVLCVRGGP
jgi:hypothetical protein